MSWELEDSGAQLIGTAGNVNPYTWVTDQSTNPDPVPMSHPSNAQLVSASANFGLPAKPFAVPVVSSGESKQFPTAKSLLT